MVYRRLKSFTNWEKRTIKVNTIILLTRTAGDEGVFKFDFVIYMKQRD